MAARALVIAYRGNVLPPIVFDDVQNPLRDAVRNLGVTFDKPLTRKPQVAKVSKRRFAACMFLHRLRNLLPLRLKPV